MNNFTYYYAGAFACQDGRGSQEGKKKQQEHFPHFRLSTQTTHKETMK